MSRLIVTGCSFTNHLLITWPVFLSSSYDCVYNFGTSGAGNEYIFHSVLEADQQLNINENDTVIVQWSGLFRFDKIVSYDSRNYFWETRGDWSHYPVKKFENLQEFLNEPAYIYRACNYILHMYKFLKLKKVKFLFTFLYSYQIPEMKDLLFEIEDCLFLTSGISDYIKSTRGENLQYWGAHPAPSEHYKLAQRIGDELGINVDTLDDIYEFDKLIGSENNLIDNIQKIQGNADLFRECVNIQDWISNNVKIQSWNYHPHTLDNIKKLLMKIFENK